MFLSINFVFKMYELGKKVMYIEIFHTRDSRLKGRKIFDWANNTDLLKPFVSIYLAKQNSLDPPKYS